MALFAFTLTRYVSCIFLGGMRKKYIYIYIHVYMNSPRKHRCTQHIVKYKTVWQIGKEKKKKKKQKGKKKRIVTKYCRSTVSAAYSTYSRSVYTIVYIKFRVGSAGKNWGNYILVSVTVSGVSIARRILFPAKFLVAGILARGEIPESDINATFDPRIPVFVRFTSR